MPRGVRKENLPSKICVICNRPFSWRKKWEKCWEDVTTCSKSCNRKRRQGSAGQRSNAAAIAGTKSDDVKEDDDDDNCCQKNDDNVSYNCNNDNRREMDSLTVNFESMKTYNDDVDGCMLSKNSSSSISNNNSNNNSTIQKLAMIVTLAGTNAEAFSLTTSSSTVLSTTNNAHRTLSSVTTTALFHGDMSKENVHEDESDNLADKFDPNELLQMVSADNLSGNIDENNNNYSNDDSDTMTEVDDVKARRKAEKKQKKAERRAQRQGIGDPTIGQKSCTICNKSVDLLIRCTYDASADWVSGTY
jgi:hypothetical protein